MCHVILCDETTDENASVIDSSDRKPRRDKNGKVALVPANLTTCVGKQCIEGQVLNDPIDGQPKLFFVFQDLSLRVLGKYRFLCYLIDMTQYPQLTRPHLKLKPLITNSFEVYSFQMFPGVGEVTTLTKSFTLQGIQC